ncbi:hypothetical protein SacN8_06345 [Sulfolobus acidocaldarius N8]|uniref:Uncharacterized protein n=2 Tax=Sulfolobus acidocaldarius TaxID=2285 RepID=M1J206_9CREN|nr:hypothetical protein SacN8_06345 [Sulfolobus acidocaldarius N8]AGE73504.1 hypothetical protein SacRon12I_06340 [Sulfolobus acidocaldarius Ron12/I]
MTDRGLQAKAWGFRSNSEPTSAEEGGSGSLGVRLGGKRGTTQTWVKAPKSRLSANEKASPALDSGKVGPAAAIL